MCNTNIFRPENLICRQFLRRPRGKCRFVEEPNASSRIEGINSLVVHVEGNLHLQKTVASRDVSVELLVEAAQNQNLIKNVYRMLCSEGALSDIGDIKQSNVT